MKWVSAALEGRKQVAELVIRVVDESESQTLNSEYRGKHKPTNVLSFPFEAPPQIDSDHIGDLVICAPVVIREATEQHKLTTSHWAHMVIHGVLHLLGFDHQSEQQALVMETAEKEILAGLGIADPYEEQQPT